MPFEIVNEDILASDFQSDDLEIDDFGNNELAVGLKVPTSLKVPATYIHNLRKYNDLYNNIYQQMEVANKLYKYNSVVGNAVDVLIDFAVTDVRPMPTGARKLDKILEYWFENLNSDNTNGLPGVEPLSQELCLEWFTSGNAFPYTKWNNVMVNKTMTKLPSTINLINPQSITIPTEPIAFGQEFIYLKYDSALIDKLRLDGRTSPEAAIIKHVIPRSIINSIKRGSSMDGVRLNNKFVIHLKRRAKGYQAWGIPYLTRCFSPVSILERLRELDESIAAGLMNLITIFKIGTEEHPASPERLRKFASLLRNPKATTTLVWAHDIEVLQKGPDGKVLAFKDKYKDAKQDVLIALGVPPILMGMGTGSDDWVAILSLVERLANWRKTIKLYLEGVCNDIAKYNGFEDKKVKVKWGRMNLTNDAEIKNLVLAFYDRGLISIDTSLRESGYNVNHELLNKEREVPYKDKFVPPDLPFSSKNEKEVEKKKPNDSDVKVTKTNIKKTVDKTKSTVDLKVKKGISKPGNKNNL